MSLFSTPAISPGAYRTTTATIIVFGVSEGIALPVKGLVENTVFVSHLQWRHVGQPSDVQ